MAFTVKDLMTKIVPGASPGPRIWACPDDSHCDDECPDDSHGNEECPDDSNIPPRCPDDSNVPPPRCPDDSNIPPNCPDDSRYLQAAGRGNEALALLQRQLRERLDSVSEARI